jgi:hypothetical protein
MVSAVNSTTATFLVDEKVGAVEFTTPTAASGC